MSDLPKSIITLHLYKWTLPHLYAKEKNVSNQVVHNWIKRKQIDIKVIPELDNLILVARGSENKKKAKRKKK